MNQKALKPHDEVRVEIETDIQGTTYLVEGNGSVYRMESGEYKIEDIEFLAWDENGNFLDQRNLSLKEYNEVIDDISEIMLLAVTQDCSKNIH